ncbi:MAG: heparinase II/III-family protein [Treponema sp.]|jgi:hypothetical protein|nr:heparinase II/III-family protein [Treponema sp.]
MLVPVRVLHEFKPFPAYTDREAWEGLNGELKTGLCEAAQKIKGTEWESIPAALYLDFFRNGDRRRFQARYDARRYRLYVLLLAECIEGRGEYLDEIINGVWLVSEETSWVYSAHNYGWHAKDSKPPELPNIEYPVFIDLFSAETGALFSWIYYFLSDAIGALSPLVKRRIELEVERRILAPFLEHDDYGWSCLQGNEKPNNWTAWINSNLLVSYLVFAKSFSGALEGVNKTIRSMNIFIDRYPEDGGCDEGPGYFNAAAASLFDFIEELSETADVSPVWETAKLRNMAAYIYKVCIGKGYFVNYADAPPRVGSAWDLLERIGKKTGDERLLKFARWRNGEKPSFPSLPGRVCMSFRFFADLFGKKEAERAEPEFSFPQLSWFKDIQVVTARDREDREDGFFFSAKGGNNQESHNHNDIGNFILYYNSHPVIVDAGSRTYTRSVFGESRYSFWNHRSSYHNTPDINGFEQMPGSAYRAGDVSFVPEKDGGVHVSMDISPAYPAESGVNFYRRNFVFKPGEGLTITDSYRLSVWKGPLVLNLLCHDRPVPTGENGKLLLSSAVVLEYNPEDFSVETEEVVFDDAAFHAAWQKDSLFRLRLTLRGQDRERTIRQRFALP